ncbi:MAG: histidine phosphatase family protein [bacterium]|nr:histidine phosphatase family protein [bacterium]
MPTDLILVCHGQSALQQGDGRFGWWSDVSLSTTGARQALLLGDRLRTNFNVDALYTSPLQRARETADILAQMVKTVAVPEPGLREIDSGKLAELSYKEALEQYPDLIRQGGISATERLPGGESGTDLLARVERTLNQIVTKHSGQQIVVVTHGGPIVSYLMVLMGYTWQTSDRPYFVCDAISMHHIRIEAGEKTVVRLNDTAHLAGMPSTP